MFGVLSRTKCDDPACFSIHRPHAAFQNRIAGGRHPCLAWLHLRRCITFLTVAPTPRTPHVQAPPSPLAHPVARAPLPIQALRCSPELRGTVAQELGGAAQQTPAVSKTERPRERRHRRARETLKGKGRGGWLVGKTYEPLSSSDAATSKHLFVRDTCWSFVFLHGHRARCSADGRWRVRRTTVDFLMQSECYK